MILVFFILGILIIFTLIAFIIISSTLKIKIENFNIENYINNKKYKIKIQLYFLNVVKILSLNIDNKKTNKIFNSSIFTRFNYNNVKDKLPSNKNILKSLKLLNIKIEKFNLKVEIGVNNIQITSYIVVLISTILSMFLYKKAKNTIKNNKIKENKIKKNKNIIYYKIKPLYNIENFNLFFESIISIKMVHIISILLYLVKKGRDEDGRTSNRRSYDHSHEFN